MSVYRIADLNISIEPKSEYFKQQIEPYEVNCADVDFSVSVNQNEIDYEISIGEFSDYGICESLAVFRKICKKILYEYNGILFHSAVIVYKEKAYIFTAKSGTGKTTHIRLWKKLLGDKVKILNGDKPILREKDGQIIAYGTPWQGKENYGCNMQAPLGGVFLLNRGVENSVEKADVKTAIPFMLSQTLRYQDEICVSNLLSFFEKMILTIPIYNLYCNMELSAVETSLSVIEKQESNI